MNATDVSEKIKQFEDKLWYLNNDRSPDLPKKINLGFALWQIIGDYLDDTVVALASVVSDHEKKKITCLLDGLGRTRKHLFELIAADQVILNQYQGQFGAATRKRKTPPPAEIKSCTAKIPDLLTEEEKKLDRESSPQLLPLQLVVKKTNYFFDAQQPKKAPQKFIDTLDVFSSLCTSLQAKKVCDPKTIKEFHDVLNDLFFCLSCFEKKDARRAVYGYFSEIIDIFDEHGRDHLDSEKSVNDYSKLTKEEFKKVIEYINKIQEFFSSSALVISDNKNASKI